MLQAVPEARSTVLAALSRACVAMGEWEEATELSLEFTEGEEVPRDVARAFWWGVAKHQRDVARDLSATEAALIRALQFDEDSAEILEALARVQSRAPGRAFVLTMMRLSAANGGDLPLLREAAEVAIAVRSREDPLLARVACERLFELAVERWTPGGDSGTQGGDRSPRVIAFWALGQLVAAAREANDDYQALELLKRGAQLPFASDEIQRMKRDAAEISEGRLHDPATALALYRELIEQDPASDVAKGALERFANLLAATGRHEELTALCERQARLRGSEDPTAAALWGRAGRLAEERLDDVDRAVDDYLQGAELGDIGSLEALARIRRARGDEVGAITMLQRICELAPREDLVENTLRLVDALARTGQASLATARLERTLLEVGVSEPLASRLADFYRKDQAWDALADLLVSQARGTDDPGRRLAYLAEAVDLFDAKLANSQATIPMLEQMVELDPDNPARRLALAKALIQVGRTDQAIQMLEAQVARYAARRPKDRALVHFALAAATSDPKRALSELEIASRIDPTHPGILFALGQRAFHAGQLDLAEQTYKSLLLLCRGRVDAEQQAMRVQLLSDLADIADRKNDPERAAELRASARETSG
jgi:tetratricopeptide (TPR) repeat protein